MSALRLEIRDAVLDALRCPEGRAALREIVADAISKNDDALVDVEEAARVTGRTKDAIYRAVSRGTMPGLVRVGGLLRFKRSALVGGAR